ncbi:hypothetical protein FRC14_004087 [Serendipita sp. 396]|nr:hypothetical protein FRC14_004087 [Serendipita sp. 396]KAG8874225.1 hypothetical protein FRC20_006431 [Serendipita sp. 405]
MPTLHARHPVALTTVVYPRASRLLSHPHVRSRNRINAPLFLYFLFPLFTMKGFLHLLLGSLSKRETPQELSHDRYIIQVKQMLDLNNTIGVADPTFALLTNELAATGMGSVTDPNCLQLAIADVAFTNAKATNNLDGLVASLIFRALERNTAAVGVASEPCLTYVPVNKELLTFKQHQDPASPGAQINNKAVVLELARQISQIGGEPSHALYSGTFAPGEVGGDPKGNSCNNSNCIFEEGVLMRDASPAEIYDYVGKCVDVVTSTIGVSGSTPTGGATIENISSVSGRTSVSGQTATRTTVPSAVISTPSTSTTRRTTTTSSSQQQQQQQTTTTQPNASSTSSTQGNGSNLQTYTGSLFGIGAPAVTLDNNGRYHVDTITSTFSSLQEAILRSCSIQKNSCANTANQQRVSVSQCDTQEGDCKKNSGYA